MKFLILGKRGQLGKEFVKLLSSKGFKFVALGREECDITKINHIRKALEEIKPDIVINCTAYNFVDKAEKEYWNAYEVNAFGVKILAELCAERKTFLIHYSTDYVFDGTKENGLYTEEDQPNPLNKYAESKFLGEIYLQRVCENYLLFRVSWVYGEGKQNFIYKLLQWAKNQDYLKIAYDEVSVPTSTRTIAKITLKAIEVNLKGIYHLVNSGYASRYEYAKNVLKCLKINKFIKPVPMEIFNLPAKRPKFSAMSNAKISSLLNIEIPVWEEELEKFLTFYFI